MITITLGGRSWPIRFDMHAIEAIQKRYGGLTDLGAAMADTAEISWLLSLIINEGLKMRAYETGMPGELTTPGQIGMLLTPADLASDVLAESVVDALNEGLGSKKYTAAGLMTIGRTMMTGRTHQKMSR